MAELKDVKSVKYPKQIDSCSRPDKTLGIEANLFVPTADEMNDGKKNPLEMHARYSVFKFSLINGSTQKESGVSVVNANIPAGDIYPLYDNTQSVLPILMQSKLNPVKKEKKESLAYTLQIGVGKFGNKTAAEVLLENPANKNDLVSTRNWLNQNATKYPKNAEKVKAIDEAILLFDEGKLNPDEAVPVSTIIPIYNGDGEIRLPHAKKVDENGCTDVYSISIVCDLSRNNPFLVKIMNCVAPPIVDGTGKVAAELSKAMKKKEYFIYLTKDEWLRVCNKLKNTLDNFERMTFENQWAIADKFANAWRK